MGETHDDMILHISSLREPDKEPMCILSWHGQDWPADLMDVVATVMDLYDCATYAELSKKMLDIGIPKEQLSMFLNEVASERSDRGKSFWGAKTTVTLNPAVLAGGDPVVMVSRGSVKAVLSSDSARIMGNDWLQVAMGTYNDRHLTTALRQTTYMTEEAIQAVFDRLAELKEEER